MAKNINILSNRIGIVRNSISFFRGQGEGNSLKNQRLHWGRFYFFTLLLLFSCSALAADDLYEIKDKASAGNPVAQANLGRMYHNGQSVNQDYEKAVYWFRKAADQGLITAQTDLAFMYITGRGVDKDYVQAYKWLDIASTNGNEHAIKGRYAIAQRMTQEQIDQAKELAKDWISKHIVEENVSSYD